MRTVGIFGVGFTAIAAAAGAGGALPEPLPISGEYVQPFTYADGTQLISLPGWDTYDAAGVTTVASGRGRLQVKSNTLVASSSDFDGYLTGALAYLRDVGSANQVVRFKIGGFFSGTSDTVSPDGHFRIIFGATDRQNSLVLNAVRSSSALTNFTVSKLVAGTATSLGSVTPSNITDFARNITAGDTVEVTLRGAVVHISCNGVRLTPAAGIAVTSYTPGTLAGIGSNNRNWRLDDYYAAPLTATSVAVNRGLSFWPSSDTGRLVTLTGTTTGTPTYLQTRVISAVDHSEIVPWTTNATATFGSGTFSVSVFEPIGDLTTRARYITQVRPIEDINGWGNYHAHAVGPQFTLYGQSNSAFRDGGATTTTGNAYAVFNANQAKNTSVDPWVRGIPSSSGIHVYANTLAQKLGKPVGVICCGIGAQPIEALIPTGSATFASDFWPTPLNPWGILMATHNKVGATGYSRALHWTQGEAGANGFGTPSVVDYQDDFVALAAAFRSQVAISPTAPITISIIGTYNGAPTNGEPQANINWSLVRQTLMGLPALNSDVHVSSSFMHLTHQDAFHYTAASYAEVNRRDAQTAAKLMGVSTYDGRGPIITSGTRSGAVIAMAVDLNGAASIAGSSVTGFDASADDFATLLTISSVNVSDGNVVITLAADPATAVKVRSYWGYRPTQTSVITGTYSDGTTIQAEPIYNPITVS